MAWVINKQRGHLHPWHSQNPGGLGRFCFSLMDGRITHILSIAIETNGAPRSHSEFIAVQLVFEECTSGKKMLVHLSHRTLNRKGRLIWNTDRDNIFHDCILYTMCITHRNQILKPILVNFQPPYTLVLWSGLNKCNIKSMTTFHTIHLMVLQSASKTALQESYKLSVVVSSVNKHLRNM